MAKRINFWELPIEDAQPDDTVPAYRGRGQVARVRIADVGGDGTVTSVAVSMPAGFQVANSPVTTSGTITVTFAAGYGLPTTAAMGQWSTAFGWGDHAQAGYALASAVTSALAGKVDKVAGKGLSTEDYTTAEKGKLAGIQAGAQVNAVTSVAGKTGAVTLAKGDVGLGNVDNTSDADKPISTAVSVALSGKVDTSDARLTNSREWTASTVGQAEAEAGSATTRRAWTAQRVRQNVVAWWNGSVEKAKLDSVQAGATANATDAQLRDRSTHTGTQAISTVTGLSAALDAKVDKVAGYGLSQSDFTPAEKAKLAGLESSRFKGVFASVAALQSGVASPGAGDYADVDAPGQDVSRYIWDATDTAWVKQAGEVAPLTAAQIKSLYEANPDTNAFTDAEKSKLQGVAAGATANTGTVTSVQVAVPTGLQASGGPVTSSGTLTISYQTGYSIPANSKQSQWDTAYGWGNHASAGYATTSALASGLAGKVDTTDARLTDAREWTASTVTQATAEAGTSTVRFAWTAQRVWQAITAWWNASAAKDKLDNIQAGATANQTDAYLLNRANHTGTQAASTITGLATVATTGSYNDLSNKPAIPAGTVTSVNVSVPTGLQVSGGPVTTSGTLTISYATGYSIPANSKQSQWDAAYGWGNHASAGYALASGLAVVATSGSYNDLSNKPTIPTLPATVSQAEAEAGSATTARLWTSQRVRQSVAAFTYDKATIDSKIDAGGGGGGGEETYPYRGVLTTEDLNDVRESGVYGQPSTPNATLARNYPANIAGALEVLVLNAATTPYPIVTQRYTTNEGTQRIFIRRGGAQGGWNAWREIAIGVGTNAYRDATISTTNPSGGSDGDVWYQIDS